MEEVARQFAYTIALRPYFFLFFLAYLLGCTLQLGLLRALLFTIIGFAVAWSFEHSSIHTGFPFGHYYYTELTKGSELWVWDVPFIDSMSFVFLSWASYSVALLALCPEVSVGRGTFSREAKGTRHPLRVSVLAAFFFASLDVIIDPVALRGDRWFLGKLYYYPEPGFYFGVPLANFAGWLLVGFVLVWLLQLMDLVLERSGVDDWMGGGRHWGHLAGPAVYLCVIAFNITVTFLIGEYLMGWAGVVVFLAVLGLVTASQLCSRCGVGRKPQKRPRACG